MKFYEVSEVYEKLSGAFPDKYFMYIQFNENSENLHKNLKYSAPYLDFNITSRDVKEASNISFIAFAYGQMMFEFDSEKECYQYFNQTHCDYNESLEISPENFISVYACVYHNGKCETKNT